MPLSEDDVREILRLIDESDVEELRIETDGALAPRRARRGRVEAARAGRRTPRRRSRRAAATGDLVTISAPMLGTFYRAEAPGARAVRRRRGARRADTVVCLIEVMKMMNAVPAGVVGTIVEVCAENAELVEYGAPLFQVQPDR